MIKTCHNFICDLLEQKMHSLRHQFESFNSEASVSSISSIESLLDSRRDNLEDILFSLGFGVGDDENPINKIPKRFLESPSVAKGINLEEFIKANTSLNKLVDQQSSAGFAIAINSQLI